MLGFGILAMWRRYRRIKAELHCRESQSQQGDYVHKPYTDLCWFRNPTWF